MSFFLDGENALVGWALHRYISQMRMPSWREEPVEDGDCQSVGENCSMNCPSYALWHLDPVHSPALKILAFLQGLVDSKSTLKVYCMCQAL